MHTNGAITGDSVPHVPWVTRRGIPWTAANSLNGFRMNVGRATIITALVLAAWACPGCGTSLTPPPARGDLPDGNRDSTLTSPLGKTSGEPNNGFSQAIVSVFDASRTARLQGTVSEPGDIDVFLLGTLSSGDQLTVDTHTASSPLDVSVALFDGEQRLVYNNDDRGGSPDRFLDSYVQWVVRHDSPQYFLAVSHSAFAGSGTFTGSYTIDVTVRGTFTVPPPKGQILLLDFDGAEVDSPTLGRLTLEPFDAAAISPVYAGETQTIKDTIRAVFEQNFERFDVTVVTTDDPVLPGEKEASTIFFGGFDHSAFGIAESVDLYNADICDDAIIFTESFDPRVFSFLPTAEELGIAIGNVGSHEGGHLLGLNHVDDDRALMDDQSAADAFVDDQEFMEAPLSKDIMSIGMQDAVLLLNEIVGRAASATAKGIAPSTPDRLYAASHRRGTTGGMLVKRQTSAQFLKGQGAR